jgi:chromosome segregation ATPase
MSGLAQTPDADYSTTPQSNIHEKYHNLKVKFKRLQNDFKSTASKYAELIRERREASVQAADLFREQLRHNEEHVQLTTAITDLQSANEQLRFQLNLARKSTDEASSKQIQSLQRELALSRGTIEQSRSETDRYALENADLQVRLESLTKVRSSLAKSVRRSQKIVSENESLKLQLSEAKSQNSKLTEEIDRLNSNSPSAKLNSAEKRIRFLEHSNSALQGRLIDMESELSTASSANEEYLQTIESHREQQQMSASRIRDLESQIGALQNKADSLAWENLCAKRELEAIRSEYERDIRKAADPIPNSYPDENREMAEIVSKLQEQFDELSQRHSLLLEQIVDTELIHENERLRDLNSNLSHENEELRQASFHANESGRLDSVLDEVDHENDALRKFLASRDRLEEVLSGLDGAINTKQIEQTVDFGDEYKPQPRIQPSASLVEEEDEIDSKGVVLQNGSADSLGDSDWEFEEEFPEKKSPGRDSSYRKLGQSPDREIRGGIDLQSLHPKIRELVERELAEEDLNSDI